MFARSKESIGAIAQAVNLGAGSSCYNSDSNYAVAVGLRQTPNTSWCIDSTGTAKVINFDSSSAINSSTFLCN
jgi:hypothetical protein